MFFVQGNSPQTTVTQQQYAILQTEIYIFTSIGLSHNRKTGVKDMSLNLWFLSSVSDVLPLKDCNGTCCNGPMFERFVFNQFREAKSSLLMMTVSPCLGTREMRSQTGRNKRSQRKRKRWRGWRWADKLSVIQWYLSFLSAVKGIQDAQERKVWSVLDRFWGVDCSHVCLWFLLRGLIQPYSPYWGVGGASCVLFGNSASTVCLKVYPTRVLKDQQYWAETHGGSKFKASPWDF